MDMGQRRSISNTSLKIIFLHQLQTVLSPLTCLGEESLDSIGQCTGEQPGLVPALVPGREQTVPQKITAFIRCSFSEGGLVCSYATESDGENVG